MNKLIEMKNYEVFILEERSRSDVELTHSKFIWLGELYEFS